MIKIYDAYYSRVDEEFGEFDSVETAVSHIRQYLSSDDFVYLIGTDDDIQAMFFQGGLYRLTEMY